VRNTARNSLVSQDIALWLTPGFTVDHLIAWISSPIEHWRAKRVVTSETSQRFLGMALMIGGQARFSGDFLTIVIFVTFT
jgi:hypothetical protein